MIRREEFKYKDVSKIRGIFTVIRKEIDFGNIGE